VIWFGSIEYSLAPRSSHASGVAFPINFQEPSEPLLTPGVEMLSNGWTPFSMRSFLYAH
jgi:hypothetical protein